MMNSSEHFVKLTTKNLSYDSTRTANLLKQVQVLPTARLAANSFEIKQTGSNERPSLTIPNCQDEVITEKPDGQTPADVKFEFDFDAISPEDCVEFKKIDNEEPAELILETVKHKIARIHMLTDLELLEIFNSKSYIKTKNGELFDQFDDSRIFEYHINLEQPRIVVNTSKGNYLAEARTASSKAKVANARPEDALRRSLDQLEDERRTTDQESIEGVEHQLKPVTTVSTANPNIEGESFDQLADVKQTEAVSVQDERPDADPNQPKVNLVSSRSDGQEFPSNSSDPNFLTAVKSCSTLPATYEEDCDSKIILRIPKRQTSCWVYSLALFLKDDRQTSGVGGHFDLSSINQLLQGRQLSQNAERFKSLFENFQHSSSSTEQPRPDVLLSSGLMSSFLMGSSLSAMATRKPPLPGAFGSMLSQDPRQNAPDLHQLSTMMSQMRTGQAPSQPQRLASTVNPELAAQHAKTSHLASSSMAAQLLGSNVLPAQLNKTSQLLNPHPSQLNSATQVPNPVLVQESLAEHQSALVPSSSSLSSSNISSLPVTNQLNNKADELKSLPVLASQEQPSSLLPQLIDMRLREAEARLAAQTKTRIAEAETRLTGEIEAAEHRLMARVDQCEARLSSKLDEVLTAINQMNQLQRTTAKQEDS